MRAIILAAGLGSRLRPITNNIPKSLISVNNKPLIETQIEYLHDIGINDIVIVTGYLSEKFAYLRDKYGVKTVFNEFYSSFNNIYTMSLVIDLLPNSYVIDADVFMCRNFLDNTLTYSCYFSGLKKTINEWQIIHDDNKKVVDIKSSNGLGLILSGVSFWSYEDGNILNIKLKEKISKEPEKWKTLYWDDIVKENLHTLNVKFHEINTNDWFEIDSVDDYEDVLNLYPNK
ncbi:NTP transferase domain-containing protein [Photobacterium damselae]|uniref:sugar phosphate nucleotidyltransferase n=1 Tax=Photobacterium damselae TaxID=38293 RepID=UPI002543F48D